MTVKRFRGAACLAACLLAACSREQPPSATPARRPDIIFILVDTLRRDHVGIYGEVDGVTPFIDSLAASATVFDRAWAQSSWTSPSIASIFTSRYQSQHHVISFGSRLEEQERTLAEILDDNGYATGGFVSNILIDKTRGYGQGFDKFQSIGREGRGLTGAAEIQPGRGEAVSQDALNWIDSLGKDRPPVFLYVHYMDSHIPYELPESLLSKALDGQPRPDVKAINNALVISPSALSQEQSQDAKLLYKVAVSDVDRHLEALYGGLRTRGLLENSILVFTADHGEELGEHGSFGHGGSLYNEAVRVPLWIGTPDQTTREDVEANVQLIDLAPTILDLAGLPVPASFEGCSLIHRNQTMLDHVNQWLNKAAVLLRGDVRPVIVELLRAEDTPRSTGHQRAVVLGTRKLILHDDGRPEYYDLHEDPREQRSIQTFDGIPSSLPTALTTFVDHAAVDPFPQQAVVIDPETRERMRALGYTE